MMAHFALLISLRQECRLGCARSCTALHVLYELMLTLADDISHNTASLQRLHVICLLQELCTACL